MAAQAWYGVATGATELVCWSAQQVVFCLSKTERTSNLHIGIMCLRTILHNTAQTVGVESVFEFPESIAG